MSTTPEQFNAIDEAFLREVTEALKGDHNDLRREAIILRAFRDARRASVTAQAERTIALEAIMREALEALTEIARDDIGGLQALYEEHEFDPRDHSKDTCVAKMKSWMEDEATYFMGRIRYRRERARAAADKIRAALEPQP